MQTTPSLSILKLLGRAESRKKQGVIWIEAFYKFCQHFEIVKSHKEFRVIILVVF